MTVKGSVSKMIGRHLSQMDKMNKECVEDSLDALAKLAAAFTPVDTGHLAKSWRTTPVHRNSRGQYTGRIYNPVHYAASIEHGSSPHLITPTNKKALSWDGARHPVKEVMHPGSTGHHMATKAAEAFKTTGLRTKIAEDKTKKYIN